VGGCVFGNENDATGAGSSVVVECEKVLFPSLGKTIKVLPFSEKKKSDFNSTIKSMYYIGPFLFTGAGRACGIPSVFTQIYLCFQQLKTSFLLCLIEGAVSAPSSACGLG
jgi:hypothetical protein